jgi:hypothetical protein
MNAGHKDFIKKNAIQYIERSRTYGIYHETQFRRLHPETELVLRSLQDTQTKNPARMSGIFLLKLWSLRKLLYIY